jgi:hypothetical protein
VQGYSDWGKTGGYVSEIPSVAGIGIKRNNQLKILPDTTFEAFAPGISLQEMQCIL